MVCRLRVFKLKYHNENFSMEMYLHKAFIDGSITIFQIGLCVI